MLGVPSAGAFTTAILFAVGVFCAAVVVIATRARFRRLAAVEVVVAGALVASLVALPWVGWRFVEDIRTTTRLDSYERANMGPIQAYLPGYLLDGARAALPKSAAWAVSVGPSRANPIARTAFPSLALVTLFPRPSAELDRAPWLIAWGLDPARLPGVTNVRVVHPRQGPLPPVLLAERR